MSWNKFKAIFKHKFASSCIDFALYIQDTAEVSLTVKQFKDNYKINTASVNAIEAEY